MSSTFTEGSRVRDAEGNEGTVNTVYGAFDTSDPVDLMAAALIGLEPQDGDLKLDVTWDGDNRSGAALSHELTLLPDNETAEAQPGYEEVVL